MAINISSQWDIVQRSAIRTAFRLEVDHDDMVANAMVQRMDKMVMTTISSTSVKPRLDRSFIV